MVDISVSFNDRAVRKAIENYQRTGGNSRKLMSAAGQTVLRSTRSRLDAEKNVDGSRFAPLSPEYAERKRKNKPKVLRLTGGMRKTLASEVAGNGKSVRVGFGSKVARFHMSDEPRSRLPKRNPLGISKGDEKKILKLVDEFTQL